MTEAVDTQVILRRAEEQLAAVLEGQPLDENPRLQLLRALIVATRAYSASSNSIAGLRGLGLEQAVDLSREVLQFSPTSDRDVTVGSYAPTGRQLNISKPTPPRS